VPRIDLSRPINRRTPYVYLALI